MYLQHTIIGPTAIVLHRKIKAIYKKNIEDLECADSFSVLNCACATYNQNTTDIHKQTPNQT